MERSFDKEILNFLIDRCDGLDYSDISSQYKKTDDEIDELTKQIKDLLPEKDYSILSRLNDLHGYRMTAAANTAYLKGFSAGIKFLFIFIQKPLKKRSSIKGRGQRTGRH